ncbi:MAG: TIGR02281 family clan AA aspartic protease [Sphingomonas sp.]|uniref:retropepsin-like aspartic protease family protein n=1 Tax=Sphingomonas sp. TaxID=28214 RepID=UPI0025FE2340|nr:TIGR02281 family clan AA aspartic protease [Sphingomonas sp.]MBX9881836.1 TIGR02281 family clan AA aspartic protease [Sphingomonas sp.]
MPLERLLLLFVTLAGAVSAAQSRPEPVAPPQPAGVTLASAAPLIRATRDADGLFYAVLRVNGQPVRFVIDTGATHMVLTPGDAGAIGAEVIAPGAIRLTTAAGTEAGGRARLPDAVINGAALGPIDAIVAPPTLRVSLLGQDVLSRLGGLRIEGDELRIDPAG